ncbi:hypothetical protein [Tabrizicola sp.]|jgi:hypothetical protein|uniref:hypothetical protein n=1 Tax=Tabrizicola sp. TaxID=2005166 RepID=UPI0025D98DEC|nr:hypothetical protein [Tabrizicola sp.]MBY0352099.1 hypothetical protein [Tabrizicola sp.]
MTDLNTMTKEAINALLAAPLTASQLKKVSKADLIAKFDAMPASDALDADLRDARADETPPTDPTLGSVLANLTDLQKRVVVALLDAGIDCNGAETLDAMRADNMTYADVAELSQRTGLTKPQVKGVLSGLSGIVDTDVEKPNGQAGVDQVLTDFGAIVAFELLADGVVANPGPAKAEKPKKTSNVVKLPTAKKEKAAPAPKKGRSVEDRVLVQPAKDLKDVKPMTAGSKRHLICEALLRGTTMEHLAEVTGWKRDVVSSALYYDVKQVGLGVERKGGKLFLILPEGVKVLPVKDKTTSRAEALVAACK